MVKHFAALSIVLLLCCPGDCNAQTADPDPVRVGDRWSYDVKDGATGDLRYSMTVVVVEVKEKEIVTRQVVAGGRYLTTVYDRNWGVVDNGLWQFRPSGFGIKSPLELGKEWRSDANAKNLLSGAAVRTSAVIRVVGREQVTSPAGTFETFRIEIRERHIDARDQTRSFLASHVMWYAPAINRWVKRTYEGRAEGRVRESSLEELTDYSRQP